MWKYSGIFGGIYKNGFIDSLPLRIKIEERFKERAFKWKFSWQSVDMNTGSLIIFDETTPEKYRIKALLSSASIPGIFPPVEIGDLNLVDGGTFDNLCLAEAIVRCREEGFKDEDIIIDIILNYRKP